jgi:hypothetical protein
MSPFKSEKQRAWMYANKPDMAKRWEADTPEGKHLPQRVRHPEEDPPKRKKPPKRWAKR